PPQRRRACGNCRSIRGGHDAYVILEKPMSAAISSPAFDLAVEVLKENDWGTYTVPTKGLYPFQWNWDSCFTAIGQAHFDESRAWTEIETLFEHQWPDGMVPHIIFHKHDDGYFPGAEV